MALSEKSGSFGPSFGKGSCLRLGYNILPDYLSRGEVEFLSGVGWGGGVKS